MLRPGGHVGIGDLTRAAELPQELDSLLAWIACIADAQPIEQYVDWFRAAGLTPQATESHDEALIQMVRQIQAKLSGVEIMKGLNKIDLSELDFTAAKWMASAAVTAIQKGQLGCAIITAQKP